jgi:hypothetical protein
MLMQKNANIGVNLHKPPPAKKTTEDLAEEESKKKERPAWQWQPHRKDKQELTEITSLLQVSK